MKFRVIPNLKILREKSLRKITARSTSGAHFDVEIY